MSATLQTLITGAIGWLDALPDGLRALLAAGLLAAALAWFERRIPEPESHYGQSFRKSALVALLVVPLLVWLLPASRMVVFVETLPSRPDTLGPAAIATYAAWLTGVLFTMISALIAWRGQRQAAGSARPVEDARLTGRLTHWRTRLGMTAPTALHALPGDRPGFLQSGTRLFIPAAALRWPTNQQDVLIINALCSLKHRQHGWHRFAQLVSCVYWPVTWVQRLHENLCRDFERNASDLSDSCYQDRLGYARTLRQLDQRLAPGDRRPAPADPHRRRSPGLLRRVLTRYGGRLSGLLRPEDPPWRTDRLVAMSPDRDHAQWKDPYDRVVLTVGQAVFLTVLLTGVTLRERPPDIDERYLMPFGLLWKEHFHRNLELQEKIRPPG